MGRAGSTAPLHHITTVSSPGHIKPGLHLNPAITSKLVQLAVGQAVDGHRRKLLPYFGLATFDTLAASLANIFGKFRKETYHLSTLSVLFPNGVSVRGRN
jgi:hypothetical protein